MMQNSFGWLLSGCTSDGLSPLSCPLGPLDYHVFGLTTTRRSLGLATFLLCRLGSFRKGRRMAFQLR